MLVHVIADYGYGDLAFAEVRQRLALLLPGAEVMLTPVPPFDTVSAGFCVAQLALTDGPADRVVYCNVAPRADDDNPRPGNEGERLVAARLGNGALVVAVDAGHALSFVAPETDRLRAVALPESGSQFRSRDVFPSLVARLAGGDDSVLDDDLRPGSVPPPPDRAVAYVDGYGNLKTTWFEPPAPSGTRVELRIGAATGLATVSDGTFDVPAGETSFAPGSSGWPWRRGGQVAWYELFTRGSSAADLFGSPSAGTAVEVIRTMDGHS